MIDFKDLNYNTRVDKLLLQRYYFITTNIPDTCTYKRFKIYEKNDNYSIYGFYNDRWELLVIRKTFEDALIFVAGKINTSNKRADDIAEQFETVTTFDDKKPELQKYLKSSLFENTLEEVADRYINDYKRQNYYFTMKD